MNVFHEFIETIGHFPRLSILNNNAPRRCYYSVSCKVARFLRAAFAGNVVLSALMISQCID